MSEKIDERVYQFTREQLAFVLRAHSTLDGTWVAAPTSQIVDDMIKVAQEVKAEPQGNPSGLSIPGASPAAGSEKHTAFNCVPCGTTECKLPRMGKVPTMVNHRVSPRLGPHEQTGWCSVIGCHPICEADKNKPTADVLDADDAMHKAVRAAGPRKHKKSCSFPISAGPCDCGAEGAASPEGAKLLKEGTDNMKLRDSLAAANKALAKEQDARKLAEQAAASLAEERNAYKEKANTACLAAAQARKELTATEKRRDQLSAWLNEAAEEANCDLDSVAKVIRELRAAVAALRGAQEPGAAK